MHDELSTDGMKWFLGFASNKLGSGELVGVQMAITIDTVMDALKISSEVPFYFRMYLTFSWVWSLEIKSAKIMDPSLDYELALSHHLDG